MKKIANIFLIMILLITFICGCDAETLNNKKTFSAKEGSRPGIAIIGDCTVSILNKPEIYGYPASYLYIDVVIENNGTKEISFDDLDVEINGGHYGGWMSLENDSDRTVIISAGSRKTFRFFGGEGVYNYQGYLGYDLEIEIYYNDEDITKIVYPAGTYM